MAGGLPTGSNPAYITPHPFSVIGAGFSVLEERTEPNVREVLEDQVRTNPGITSLSNRVFADIDPTLGIVAGIIEAMLRRIIGSIPVVGPIAEEWTGELLDQLETYYSHVGEFLGAINFMDPDFDPQEAVSQFVNLMLLPLNILLGPNSPLSALNIFGQLPTSLFGIIPANTIGGTNPNLLTNPSFDSSISVIGGTDWIWDATEGRTTPGSVKSVATGVQKVLLSNWVDVLPGQILSPSVFVKTVSYAGTGAPYKLSVRAYGSSPGTTDIESVGASPSWSELNGTYTVPASGVNRVRLQLTVGATATGGSVWFDDATLTRGGNGPFDGLLELFGLGALTDLFGVNVNTIWSDVISTILNPLHLLEDFDARGLANALASAIDELDTIFDGSPLEAPVSAIASTVKSWWDFFFNNGEHQVVTQDRIASPSGIPPVDSATRLPWVYLPPELMTVALGMPWVQVDKTANQSITASTTTLVTSWTAQDGPTELTFDSSKFTLPFDGMWKLEIYIRWNAFGVTDTGRVTLEQNGVEIRRKSFIGVDTVEVQTAIPAATTDEFGIYVFTAAGSKQVLAAGSMIRATYMGQTTVPSLPPPPDPVQFDAIGAGAHGADDGQGWNHTFGPLGNTIVIPISHGAGTDYVESVTVGPYTVPVLSGPTQIGNYFGFNARCSLAAAILPTAVRGTTQVVQVNFSASTASACQSMSFKNVGSLGAVITSGGSGGVPSLNIPSNASSMLAVGFGGMDVNFGAFNRTEAYRRSFVAGQHWASVCGYGPGGGLLSCASGGRWHAKGIEIHP